ncbi:MAG: ATP-binding cassette domain-containing protein, partial [Oscillospiraceae bacterium]|nr:ATP-binding cassette domain-containing protein [Oscillospiraceae bacterium]
MEFSISKVINILIYSFLGTTSPSVAVMVALFIAGEWRILEKSSLKGWWALIPCARSYQLARCAGREPEGRVLCVVEFWEIVLKAIMILDAGQHNVFYNICNVTQSSIIIVGFLYKLKIFGGLIEVYSVKRRWMWLCPLPETRWIPMMVWGLNKKYQPAWKVEDFRRELAIRAEHGNMASMEKGLTVNLTERSTRDFFQKKILLWDIHMYIPQGHMVLLLGGSGAGKTTFVNAVNGYEKAKAEVVFNGQNMYTNYKEMQYDIGFVPQLDLMRG